MEKLIQLVLLVGFMTLIPFIQVMFIVNLYIQLGKMRHI